MEPLMFVMAILGCGEADSACREVRTAPVQYRTEAECLRATETELLRHDDLAFPTIVAQCRQANAAPQMLRGSDVLMPDGGVLPAERPQRFADSRPTSRR